MSTTVRMPEVLANTTEAAVQKWLVAPGDVIEVGQPFAEIETDKAVVEYAAETAGTVLELIATEGDSVDVGAPIAVVGEPGESSSGGADPAEPASTEAASSEAAAPAERSVSEAPADAESESESPDTAEAPARRQFVSPLVRRLAREQGVSLDGVTGSGPNGRIVRRDLEALLEARPSAPEEGTPPETATSAHSSDSSPASSRPEDQQSEGHLVPHSRMRATIARRLTESKNQVPHFYLTAECRVDALLAMREELKESGTVRVSINDLVVKAVAGAFVDVPEANRTWTAEGMLTHASVDIGIAVALDDGLIVPIVRGVEDLSVSSLARQIADMADRSRSGSLRPHEMEGGSFAVSNLGMYGTQQFAAIINPPQAGILAVGAARQQPVVIDGELGVGRVMTVTLSADHRAWDGALAARWLAAFVNRIEHPLTILV